MPIEDADKEIMRHTLGIGSHIRKSSWGYRNHFIAGPGHHAMGSLERLCAAGLMDVRPFPNALPHADRCYFVTSAGADLLALTKAQRKRAAIIEREEASDAER